MALEARRRRIGGGDRAIEIIDLVGRLDVPGAGLLRNTVQGILKEGSSRIAVNLAQCVEIHKEVIGTFHSLGRACIRAGGGLVIFGAAGDVNEYVKRFADKSLAPWFDDEKSAVASLGGHIEETSKKEEDVETPSIVAIGADQVFHAAFWKLTTLGGHPVAKFDSFEGSSNYISRRPIHSLLIDSTLPAQEISKFIKQIRINSKVRNVGIFIIGPPSRFSVGKLLLGEGADNFVAFYFNGEEIESKLDLRSFFSKLKEAYERFDARQKAKEPIK
jgi:hypothetical protein